MADVLEIDWHELHPPSFRISGYTLFRRVRNNYGEPVSESLTKRDSKGRDMHPVYIGEQIDGPGFFRPTVLYLDRPTDSVFSRGAINSWIGENCTSEAALFKEAAWFTDEAEAVAFAMWSRGNRSYRT